MERIVTSKILDHLYLNNIMSLAQHGFLGRRSTCANLLEGFNDWTVCVQSRQQTAVVYIDFAKAFDVHVSRKKLFAKLYRYIRNPWYSIIVDKKFFPLDALTKPKLANISLTSPP